MGLKASLILFGIIYLNYIYIILFCETVKVIRKTKSNIKKDKDYLIQFLIIFKETYSLIYLQIYILRAREIFNNINKLASEVFLNDVYKFDNLP